MTKNENKIERMYKTNLPENIYDLRKGRSLTQEQLAEAVGVSAQAVSKWETGTCLPDVHSILSMSVFFGVDVNYLFEEH